MNKSRKKYCLLSIVFLVLGISLYFMFNRNALVVRNVCSVLNIEVENQIRFVGSDLISSFGADFLWSMSFTFMIQCILELKNKKIWFLIFSSILGCLYEFLQYLGLVYGTADILDVVIYIVGTCISVIIIRLGGIKDEKKE